MNIQHDVYGDILRKLAKEAIARYDFAERLLDIPTNNRLKLNNFDHRIFQEAHDLIAAYFRYKTYIHGGLFKEEINRNDCINKWYEFFNNEVEELLTDLVFTRHIVFTILYQNTDKGYKSEDYINDALKLRYDNMLNTNPPILSKEREV
ncbi:MAG: hypothetical protein PHQ86_04700 [Dehalococcoidales bacterium]|nr:hypothetical protein [Dehalococcoidales bacterium]